MVDLVTGGGGFIGSHLVDALLEQGRKVRVVDNFAVGKPRNLEQHKDHPDLELMIGNVQDMVLMEKATENVQRVFHLAALADIVPSIQNPEGYFRSNVDGTFSALQAAQKHEVKRFVYVASSSCYGIPDSYPTPESAELRPQYPYALTKRLGEELALHWGQVYNLPVVGLRFFNVYGPRARTSGTYGAVFGVFLAQLLDGKPLTIVGDGNQTRDFTYVSDAVSALMAAADSDVCGISMNVGSDQPVSINKITRLLKAEKFINIPKRPGEPDCTYADTRLIKEKLNWRPGVSIEEGVQKMLDNIDYWRDAPVWTPDKIAEATRDWFKYLDK